MKLRISKRDSREYLLTIFLIIAGSLGLFMTARAEETASSTPTTTPEIITTSSTISESSTTLQISTTTVAEPSVPSTTVNLNLRYQNNLVFAGFVSIPASSTIMDDTGVSHFTTSTNVLTALWAADAASNAFALTQLQFYAAWNSFYVKCVRIAAPTTTELCDNWNYVVNGNYPNVGMDNYALSGGENIYVYFDNPWRLTVSSSTVEMGATTTFFTWRYNYDNLENEWMADPNDLIDISVPNPSSTGWWDTTLTVSTTQSNAMGEAPFVFSSTGTYYAKIASPDWTKWTFPLSIVVEAPPVATSTAAPSTTSSTRPETNTAPTSGGSSSPPPEFNVENAAGFISANQNADGSFTPAFLNDWTAIALSSYQPNASTSIRLKNYLLTDPNPGTSATDFERRSMALQALNINPYTGTATNYIQKILDTFDGAQFGDRNLFNDDVFALIPLLRAGYFASDNIVASTTAFILSWQRSDGSWGDVDLTAAAIQALTQVRDLPGVTSALDNAKAYLRSRQEDSGGFGNAFSTSWAMQALSALGEPESNWTRGSNAPRNFLGREQMSDGGINAVADAPARLWATAYAIPAALGKSWSQILNAFSRPVLNTTPPAAANTATPTTATTTATATTTIATTTQIDSLRPQSPVATSSADNVQSVAAATTTTNAPALPTITAAPSLSASLMPAQAAGEIAPTTFSPLPKTANAKIRTPVATSTSSALKAPLPSEAATSGQTWQAGAAPKNQVTLAKTLEQLPLDTPTRRTAKKALAVSGGGALAIGIYLGWKFLKNVI